MLKEKRELKPLWVQCIGELFYEAEQNEKAFIDISASQIRNRGCLKFPYEDFDSSPSICNAMRSVEAFGDEVIRDTKSHNSSTYTIRYKLPRFSPIPKEDIIIKTFQVNQTSVTDDKSEAYLLRLLNVFDNRDYQKKCIDECEKSYRFGDGGRTYYKKIVTYKGDKFTSEYIKLVYSILKEWNMDQQAAKLEKQTIFIKSLLDNRSDINSLSNYTIKTLDETAIEILSGLFRKLNLVKTKSPLVTFSKTLHFFLPDLIVPIDRKYTCDFFHIYPNRKMGMEKEIQLIDFINLQKAFMKFYNTVNLSEYVCSSSDWNLNVPKVIDNMIIGHRFSRKIVLLMCGGNKVNYTTKAELLYTSLRFIKSLQYAKTLTQPENIFILSAEHHLVSLNKRLAPYDKSLYDMEDSFVRLWAKKVLTALKKLTNFNTNTFMFLTDEIYSKYVISRLKRVELPLNDMSHDEQLNYFNARLGDC